MFSGRAAPLAIVAAAFGAAAAAGALPAVGSMDDGFRVSLRQASEDLAQGQASIALQRASTLAQSADQPYEKYVAAQVMLQAASATNDPRAERTALHMLLDSGQLTPEKAAEYRASIGIMSALLGERKDAIAQITSANGQGFASANSQLALAELLYASGDRAGSVAAVQQAFVLRQKEGRAPDNWYARAIALSYQAKRSDLAALWTQERLRAGAGPAEWRTAIVSYIDAGAPAPAQALDLYRLMAATNALASGRDRLGYAGLAESKGSAAEAKAAYDAALHDGDLESGDAEVKKALATLKTTAPQALAALPGLATKARQSSTLKPVMAAADAHFAAARYTVAAELYAKAVSLAQGDPEALGAAQTRLGIALARAGDLPGGKAALAAVPAGAWSPVAGFWSVWIDRKLAGDPA